MTHNVRLLSLFFSFFAFNFYAQNVGINATGTPPDASAMLDVSSPNKGLLIPRVLLTGTTDVTTVPTSATSLLVYNTATVTDVTPGYYYWDGSAWTRMGAGANTDNQNLTSTVVGSNATVNISGGISTTFSVNDADFDPTNEYNTSANLTVNNLNIIDAGGTQTVDLTPLLDSSYRHDEWKDSDSIGLNGFIYANQSLANTGDTLVITDLGKIGVGLSNPDADIHISKANNNSSILVENTETTTLNYPNISIRNYRGVSTGHTYLGFQDAKGTKATPLTMGANASTGQIGWRAHDGVSFREIGRITMVTGPNFSSTDTEGIMTFMTGDGNNYAERMRINELGNVGIGLANPINARLHVKTTSLGNNLNDELSSLILETSVGNFNFIEFKTIRHTAGSNWYGTSSRIQRKVDVTGMGFIDFGIEGVNASFGLGFGTRNGVGGTQQTRMVIDNFGNIGINTTTPSQKLEVQGSVKIVDGTQGVGKVLTSDVAGKGTWTLPASSQVGDFIGNGTGIITYATGQLIPMDNEILDPDNLFSFSAGKIVVSNAGVYEITVQLETLSNPGYLYWDLYVDGVIQRRHHATPNNSNWVSGSSLTALCVLNVGSLVSIANAGPSLNVAYNGVGAYAWNPRITIKRIR